jgi:K+-transporting ATPase c subunit
MIQARTEVRFLGIYGEPRVNVLLLNLDIDRIATKK